MDTDHQADEAWVLNVQRKLYQWSKTNPEDAWRDMWNWVTDIRNLRHAWRRVASNRGRRSAGVRIVTPIEDLGSARSGGIRRTKGLSSRIWRMRFDSRRGRGVNRIVRLRDRVGDLLVIW